jgi:hypothetical protein
MCDISMVEGGEMEPSMQHAFFAYIDPGTGSMLFQMAAAGAVTLMVALRRWRHIIVATVRGWFHKNEPEPVPTPAIKDEAPGNP